METPLQKADKILFPAEEPQGRTAETLLLCAVSQKSDATILVHAAQGKNTSTVTEGADINSIPFKRHNLVWLSDEGRELALRNIQFCYPPIPAEAAKKAIFSVPRIPGIVRRNENAETLAQKKTVISKAADMLYLGFSFPEIIDGSRLRIGTSVSPDYVTKHITPFDVAKYDLSAFPFRDALLELLDESKKHRVQLGCFGAAALQLVTGLPYLREKSDLDIYLRRYGTKEELDAFFNGLLAIEKKFKIVIDAEIEVLTQYGVKLKEMYTTCETVLGKGLSYVVLLQKSELL